MSNDRISIHTDGSCLGNPGPGGWAAIVRRYRCDTVATTARLQGNAPETTNNRMELTAALGGLSKIGPDEKAQITIYSDSQYLIRGMNEWVKNWKQAGWRTGKGKAVKNQDLWETLVETCNGLDLRWVWVQGHAGEKLNEEADAIANTAAKAALLARLAH